MAENRSLFKTINLATHEFSVLLVDPKPKMLEWLDDFIKRNGLETYRLYYQEGNLVVIIPKIDYFSSPGSFEDFLDRMKPRLLQLELQRFTAGSDFKYPITKETFDQFFNASVRESAVLMSDFRDAESLCTIENR